MCKQNLQRPGASKSCDLLQAWQSNAKLPEGPDGLKRHQHDKYCNSGYGCHMFWGDACKTVQDRLLYRLLADTVHAGDKSLQASFVAAVAYM